MKKTGTIAGAPPEELHRKSGSGWPEVPGFFGSGLVVKFRFSPLSSG